MELYIQSGEEQLGPFDSDQIAAMLERGEIDGQTPAWYEGLEEWEPLGELIEVETIQEFEQPAAPAHLKQPVGKAAQVSRPPQAGILAKACQLINMRKVQYAIGALIVALLCVVLWPSGDPAKQLAARIEKADKILNDNMDKPDRAMEKMIQAFEKEGPETIKLILELGIELTQIEDDDKREKRMKDIAEVLETPVKNFMQTMDKFEEAAWNDEKAQKVAQEYMERWMAVGEDIAALTINRSFKAGADRSAVIMNIRNCQQAMRGHQNMMNLSTGQPFTREDLEDYMMFPEDIQTPDGWIRFEAGTKVTPESAFPAENDDHIWLKVTGPGMDGVIGKYGFDSYDDITGW